MHSDAEPRPWLSLGSSASELFECMIAWAVDEIQDDCYPRDGAQGYQPRSASESGAAEERSVAGGHTHWHGGWPKESKKSFDESAMRGGENLFHTVLGEDIQHPIQSPSPSCYATHQFLQEALIPATSAGS